tara:strand:+ start:276 stop:452 length:177 start_codon:yes stop_codon:yes gene_type:complete
MLFKNSKVCVSFREVESNKAVSKFLKFILDNLIADLAFGASGNGSTQLCSRILQTFWN